MPTEDQLIELQITREDVEGKRFYFGKGCDSCNNTGYRGRIGVFEIMVFNDEIRELVMKNASTGLLREAAQRNGMRTLRESGLMLIYDGITSIDEIVKATVFIE